MALTTVNATLPRKEYTASAGQTVFTVPFEFLANADLKVYQVPDGVTPDDTTHLLTLTTDYTVVGAGVSDPGTREITLVTGATLNDTIIIEGEDEIDRDTAFLSNGDLTIAAMNAELNKLILLNKQLSMLIQNKSLQLQDSAILGAIDLTLPLPEALALLGWNSDGDALVNYTPYSEKYLGDLATPPTINTYTGLPVTVGDMYYDTSIKMVMVYTGAVWAQINSSVATAAALVSVADASGYYTGSNVEVVLQELGTSRALMLATDAAHAADIATLEARKVLVTLDAPTKLLDAVADSSNWGALGAGILTSEQADMAVLRCQVVIEGAGAGGITQRAGIFISKDLTGTPDWADGIGGERGYVAAAAYNGNGAAEFSSDQSDITVNLDGSYQFQYAAKSDGVPNSVQYYIWLVGYYK